MSQSRVYSNEDILDMLRKCDEEHESCTMRAFDAMENTCSSSLVIRRFGSWRKAKVEAGILDDVDGETPGPESKYADHEILSQLRECYRREITDEDGEVLYPAEYCTVEKLNACPDLVAASVVIERFSLTEEDLEEGESLDDVPGGWIRAKREAGINPDERATNAHPEEYSEEELLQALRDCEEEYGKVSQRELNKHDEFPSAGAVRKRISDKYGDEYPDKGGWQIAKELAGVGDVEMRKYDDEELLEMLEECKERHGKVTASTFAADEKISASPETLQRRFGSWSEAKEKAGVE